MRYCLLLILVACAACNAILGDPHACPEGSIPNDRIQACVDPCDGGMLDAKGNCLHAQADTAAGAGGDDVEAGGAVRTKRGDAGSPHEAGRSGREAPGAGAGAVSSEPGGAGGAPPAGGVGAASTAGAGAAGRGGNGGSDAAAAPRCGDGHVDPGELCDGNCIAQCPPQNPCKRAVMKGSAATCDAHCEDAAPITACASADGCCPTGCTHATDMDCSARCGDGVVDAADNELCEATSKTQPCPTEASCDDGEPCTVDMLTGTAAQCTAQCVHTPITAAVGGDQCCPMGASANTDSDCTPKCGNGVREAGEKCDGRDCPGSCSAANGCMGSEMRGSASACTAECVRVEVTVAKPGDGCCPPGANSTNDADCPPKCGNGVREGTELCDGADCPTNCDDGNPCTADALAGAGCSVKCQSTPTAGSDCGSGRMCNAAGVCEAPPARCGDGKVQAPEECDSAGETWECDTSCHRTRLYIACGAMSDCRDGQGCISGVCTTTCMQASRGGAPCPSAAIPERALGVVCDLVPASVGNYGYCRPVCQTTTDCPSGLHCTDTVCVP